ncbi:unnamed protein product, partial [marine sediment metagenome]
TYSGIVIVLLMLLVFTVPISPVDPEPLATAKFVISGWDWPDENGHGLFGMKFWENSTGEWLGAPFYITIGQFYYVSPSLFDYDWYTYNVTGGASLKVRVDTTLNATLTGATDLEDGKNYFRTNVTVTCLGIIVFSQQNLTSLVTEDDFSDPIYYYEYDIVLDFILVDGQFYTVTVTHEVFY